MHPENNDQEDFLDDEALRKISERLVGKDRREKILGELKKNSPYQPTERPSLWNRLGKRRYAILLAAAVLLALFVGRKCFYPSPTEAPQTIGLVAYLDAVDQPLPMLALDRDRGASMTTSEERLGELTKLAAQNYLNKDYATALALYEEIIDQKDSLTALYLLCQAHCEAKLKRYPAAVEFFDRALAQSEEEEEADLIYTTRFYRAITRLRIDEDDSDASSELADLANSAGYFREEAAKILTQL